MKTEGEEKKSYLLNHVLFILKEIKKKMLVRHNNLGGVVVLL
jgi:hypothetical protein